MANHRSPNCPQISFADAIEKARNIYTREHTHPASRLVIAQDLGYSGMNGRSLTLIGALRQYGVLEGSGDGLHVTKDAVAYFELDDGQEKYEAVRRMIFSPSLFSEIREQFKDRLPSDANLRHTLVGKGFSSKAADDVIAVYKANVGLVNWEESGYTEDNASERDARPMQTEARATSPVDSFIQSVGFNNFGTQQHADAVNNWTWTLSMPRNVKAELRIAGDATKADIGRLKKQIEFLEESFDEEAAD